MEELQRLILRLEDAVKNEADSYIISELESKIIALYLSK